MKMKFLGAHNFESTDTRLPSILIDGVMAIDAGSLTSGLSFAQQGNISSVLLTHGHYDHIRDIPLLALRNSYRTIDIYATQDTLDILETHLIDGTVYPKFTQWPSPENPALRLHRLEPYHAENIAGYGVLPIPVSHAIPAVGFEITGKRGQKVFFSGDTGPGLSSCWEYISPSILIIETTFPNKLADIALQAMHLCPLMLGTELINFQQTKGYFPRVVLTHLNPEFEDEIRREVGQMAQKLGIDIRLAYEGMEL
ncbi:MAG: MBL fold metallo-hydrolase [Dehalococcoidia bacterium]|nr:MBL fold metallo-hydrolase [Dehalococcoidia bacterium]